MNELAVPMAARLRSPADVLIFQGFIAVMPFLHAPGLILWLPVPLIYASLALLLYLVSGRLTRAIYFRPADILLGATLLLGAVAILFNLQYAGSKNLNFLAAFLATTFIFFIWVRGWLRLSRPTMEDIGKAATLGLLVAALGVIIDFTLANTRGIYLADIIPYSTDELPVADVLDTLKRPRGFAAEPGFAAITFEALAPLAWVYLRSRKLLLWPTVLIAGMGFVLLFSAGALLAVSMSVLIVAGGRRGGATKWIVVAVAVMFGLAVLLGGENVVWLFDEVVGRKVVDLVGQGDVPIDEVAGRYNTYQTAISVLLTKPLGVGWGEISQLFDSGAVIPGIPALNSRGMLSLYLEILVSAGVAGLVCFIAFVWQHVAALWSRRDAEASAVLVALLSVALHHAAVLEFWFPMLWFLLALADHMSRQHQTRFFALLKLPIRSSHAVQ